MSPTVETLEELNAVQRWAWDQVRTAIRQGKLVKPSVCPLCDSKARLRAHHDDYTKPLQVSWMCERCHKARHKEELRKAARRLGLTGVGK